MKLQLDSYFSYISQFRIHILKYEMKYDCAKLKINSDSYTVFIDTFMFINYHSSL